MTIDARDVSVVVQGPLSVFTPDVLRSVRDRLPAAELILSTWRGTGGRDHDVDLLVESEDPGSVPYWPGNSRQFNTVRLMRTSREGVARAGRRFVLKLRSDTPLTGTGFLDWFGAFPARGHELRVFEERVLTISVATRPARGTPSLLFHPSDCVHFGLAEDVRHLWSGEEPDEAANARYWLPGGGGAGKANPGSPGPALWNEQLVWLDALRRAGHEVEYPYFGFVGRQAEDRSDAALVNNFLVLEPWQFGVRLSKLESTVRVSDPRSYLWFDDWIALHQRSAVASSAVASQNSAGRR